MKQYELDYQFQHRSKKYRQKYLESIKQLFGGKDAVQEAPKNNFDREFTGMADTSSIGEVGNAARIIIDFDS